MPQQRRLGLETGLPAARARRSPGRAWLIAGLLTSAAGPALAQSQPGGAAPSAGSAQTVTGPAQPATGTAQTPSATPQPGQAETVPGEVAGVPPLVTAEPVARPVDPITGGDVAPSPLANNVDPEGFPVASAVLGVFRGFDYGVNLTTEYSDNLLRRPSASNSGDRADIRFRPSVFVNAGLPVGRNRLFASASYGRDIYGRNTHRNSRRLEAQAGATVNLSRCNLQLTASRQERQAAFDLFVDELQQESSNVQKRTNFSAAAGCPGLAGLSPTIGVRYGMLDNSLEVRRIFDNRTFGANAGLSYNLAARGRIAVSGFYSKARFPNNDFRLLQETPIPDVFQALSFGALSSTSYGGDVSLSYRFGPFISADVGVGYSKARTNAELLQAPVREFGGTTYRGGLRYSGPRLGAALSIARDVTLAPGGSQSFYLTERYDFGATYTLGAATELSAGVTRSKRQFISELPEDPSQPQAPRRLSETQDRVYVGASQTLGRVLNARLELSHARRRANPSIYDYDSNNILLQLNATF